MNRREFLSLLAQSAAALPTTSYFIFGSGVWKPRGVLVSPDFDEWFSRDLYKVPKEEAYWRVITWRGERLWTDARQPRTQAPR